MVSYQPAAPNSQNDGRKLGEEQAPRSHSYGTVHGIENGEDEALEIEQGRNLFLADIYHPRLVPGACGVLAALLAATSWYTIRSRRGSLTTTPSTTPSVMRTCAKPPVLWSDEFEGSDIDLNKWTPQEGDGCDIGLCGWGNAELERYSSENIRIEDGYLVMEARFEDVAGEAFAANAKDESDAATQHHFTSSKILSKGKGDFGPIGRFSSRVRLPSGNGIWPAFWMLPTDDVYGTWPSSGEIDIMENIGKEGPNTVHGTIHYGKEWPMDQYSEEGILLDTELYDDFSENFHVFSVEREDGIIRWFVDDILYSTKTRMDIAPYAWPFDENFYFIFNVAIGGNWPGNPDNTTLFPQQMTVDYVRVYGGLLPRVDGKGTVLADDSGIEYSFVGGDATNFSWSVPNDAVIMGGQGTDSIIVTFGKSEGVVSVSWDWTGADCALEQGSAAIRVKVIDTANLKKYAFDCGRPGSCTEVVLNRDADGHSCGDRIQWLMDGMGSTEMEACATISYDECNGRCSPCFPSAR